MFSASMPELSGRRQLLLLLVIVAGAAAGVLARSLDPLPLLLLGAALVGGLLTLFRVEFGVLALIFVAYTRFSDVLLEHGVPLSVVELMVAGMLLVMVLRWYFFDEMPEGWLRPTVYLGLYGLVGLASVLYATDGELALASWINYLQDGILVLLLVAGLQQAGALRRASWVLLLAGAFMGTFSVVQQVTGAFDSNFAGFSVVELEHIAGGTNVIVTLSRGVAGAPPSTETVTRLSSFSSQSFLPTLEAVPWVCWSSWAYHWCDCAGIPVFCCC